MKYNSVQPRQRILETALQLFHRQGYNSTGINQIIEESSVAKATLYQHFKSKEELAVEYLNSRHIFWFDQLRLFTDREKSPQKKVLAAFDFLKYMNEKENFRGCSFLNMLSEISNDNLIIMSVIQNHKKDLRLFLRAILKNENELTIDHIYILFESTITESQLFKDNWPIEQAQKIIYSLIKK